MFSILKCGKSRCNICQAPRLPEEIFKDIYHLPDPMPAGEKYKHFDELYGKVHMHIQLIELSIGMVYTVSWIIFNLLFYIGGNYRGIPAIC